MITVFLDIDGPLSTNFTSGIEFNKDCVSVLNQIIEKFNVNLVLSSDWKNHYDLKEMNAIFAWNGVKKFLGDMTPNFWGSKFNKLEQLEECRANEILKFIEDKNIKEFIAFDDLDLTPWLKDNFILIDDLKNGISNQKIKESIFNELSNFELKSRNREL